MPPKGKQVATVETEDSAPLMDMLRSMSAQLNNMENRLTKIDEIDSDVKGLKILLNDLKSENKQLKAEAKENEKKLQDMNERNNQLENRLNQLEQHHRGVECQGHQHPVNTGGGG
jgi:archaellum component FlaC